MQSHPEKKLKEHLDNVKEIGLKIFDSKQTKWKNDENIRKTLEIILKTHDYGKATEYFQEYLQNTENTKYKKSPYNELKQHGELGALWTYYFIIKEINDLKLALIGYILVKKHHGNIENFTDEVFLIFNKEKENMYKRIEKFNYEYFGLELEKDKFLKEIEKIINPNFKMSKEISKLKKNFQIEDYILCNYLFSILISADKGEAIFYNRGETFEKLKMIKNDKKYLDYKCVDNYKNNKFEKNKNEIDEIREEIYNETEKNILNEDIEKNKIFSINVPTGTGKTLTSLNTALKLKNKLKNNHKIIYALPFTSIIDQNFQIFSEVIGEDSKDSSILLKHHYLSDKDYKTNEDEFDYNISEYLIENWESEIIVTTFVQLLNSLLTNRNRSLKKFHNIADSIIILDEVQSIPYKYWKLINNILTSITETLNCYIILVTATMPLIFDEKKGEIIELAKKKEDYFKYFDRIDLDISEVNKKMNIDEFGEFAINEIKENYNNSFLFVLNTINSSLKVYEKIKKEILDKKIIYLSTNIIPKERIKRIEEIRKNKEIIIVSTQLIEAGVDIDIDRVYRDFGPLDSINQVCGRCNRNNEKNKKGIVKLFKIVDKNNKDKLYSSYVYRESILQQATEDSFKNYSKLIKEKDFLELSNNYFNSIFNRKSDDKVNELLEKIEHLQYESAFEFSNENKDIRFELISKEFKTIDLFLEIDDEACKIWDVYEEIYKENIEKYDKKEKFNKIKSKFLSYVISVPEKFYLNGKEGFNKIDMESLKLIYDNEIGFIREDKQEDFFF